MWLETKIVFSIIAEVFIGIVISQILFSGIDIMLSLLLFMAIGMIFIGDVLIGSKIKNCHADKIIDPPPAGKEFAVMLTVNNLVDFIWSDKKPHGKREFMYHGTEASYYNKGDAQIHTLNGNYGCLIHEDHDENISPDEVKVAETISDEFDTEDIKDMYHKIKELEKKPGVKIIE